MGPRKVLDVLTASRVTRIYQDNGTGAKADVAIFQADLAVVPDGYYIIGQVAVPCHTSTVPPSSIILVKSEQPVIKSPVGYNLMWHDKGSGGSQDISFWQVLAPEGYVALGDVAFPGYDKPSDHFTKKYACIKRELLAPGRLSDHPIWVDRGSGARLDGSLWQVENAGFFGGGLAGFFKANGNYNRPDTQVYVFPVAITSNR